jgi:hypothetical protein
MNQKFNSLKKKLKLKKKDEFHISQINNFINKPSIF